MTTRIGVLAVMGLLLAACGSSSAAGRRSLRDAEPPADCARADADGVIAISADQLRFSAPCMVAPAGKPVRGALHEQGDRSRTTWRSTTAPTSRRRYLEGDVRQRPGQTADYPVGALAAGEYYFDCSDPCR